MFYNSAHLRPKNVAVDKIGLYVAHSMCIVQQHVAAALAATSEHYFMSENVSKTEYL